MAPNRITAIAIGALVWCSVAMGQSKLTSPTTVKRTSSAAGSIRIEDADGSKYVGLKAASVMLNDLEITMPDDLPSVTQCLAVDATGVGTWSACAATGGAISGSGTTNTVAKFVGTSTIGDASMTDNGSLITTSVEIDPTSDDTLYLGSSSYRWARVYTNNLYTSTGLYHGGTQWMDASRNITNIADITMSGDLTALTGTVYTQNVSAAPAGETGNYVSTRALRVVDNGGGTPFNTISAVVTSSSKIFSILDTETDAMLALYRQFMGTAVNYAILDMDWRPSTTNTWSLGTGTTDRWLKAWLGSVDTSGDANIGGSVTVGSNITATSGTLYIDNIDAFGAGETGHYARLQTVELYDMTGTSGHHTIQSAIQTGAQSTTMLDSVGTPIVTFTTQSLGFVDRRTTFDTIVEPSTTDTYNLGQSSKEWNTLYVKDIEMSGAINGISTFAGGSGTAGQFTKWMNDAGLLGDSVMFETAGVVYSGGSVLPSTTETYALGGTSNRWNKLWVKDIDMSGAFSGGGGSFVVGSGAINAITKWSTASSVTNAFIYEASVGGTMTLYPSADTLQDLGAPSYRWGTVRAVAGVFNGGVSTQNITPESSLAHDLGSATLRWNNLYVKDINISGTLSGYIKGSGTTNYLPKWSAADTIGNSGISDNGSTITLYRTVGPSADNTLSIGGAVTRWLSGYITNLYSTNITVSGTVQSNLIPNGAYNLGSASFPWQYIYANNTIQSVVSSSGTAIYGQSTSGVGVSANSTNNYGLYTYSATSNAVYAVSGSVGTAAVYGTSGYRGVHGNSTNDNSSGVFGYTSGNNATGVYGSTIGVNSYGVYGIHTGSSGTGVSGNASNGTGVYGYATNGNGGSFQATSGIGVLAVGATAGLFIGPVSITGTAYLQGSIVAGGYTGLSTTAYMMSRYGFACSMTFTNGILTSNGCP